MSATFAERAVLTLVACASLHAAARAATRDQRAGGAAELTRGDAPAWLAPHNPSRAPTAVRGAVADPAGHAIAGALIVPRSSNPRALPALAVSDRLGQFEFIGLPPGEYAFVAIHLGYAVAATPAMPVEDRLRVSIILTGADSA